MGVLVGVCDQMSAPDNSQRPEDHVEDVVESFILSCSLLRAGPPLATAANEVALRELLPG